MNRIFRTLAVSSLAGASIVFGAVVVIPIAKAMDDAMFPVRKDWTVTSYTFDGKDLVISGTFVKVYNCSFRPPPRAREVDGADLLASSESKMRDVVYPAGPAPRPFGPWRIADGAGKAIDFYYGDQCHPLWQKTTYLGRFDAAAGVQRYGHP